MFFSSSLAVLMIQTMLAIWSLVPLRFLNPAWTSGSSSFTYCWSLAWRILSITLLACEMSAIVWLFAHFFDIPFFGIDGEGNGNPLQYSCLENPMDGGAWWATVHGVAKSRTQLSDFTFTFFGIEMKTDLFWSYGHCWVFQICWHIECSILTASTFRICNSLTGIPSSPLAFFIVMLPKAHLTSHTRMSGPRWVITPL